MRADIAGMFWDEIPPPKPPKEEKPKRTPPARTWESPDYLPYLDEALAFEKPLFTDAELVAAAGKEPLILDIESYRNYFLIAFKSVISKKIFYVELHDSQNMASQRAKLLWIMQNFLTIGFNSNNYDLPILAIALEGFTPKDIKEASDFIIREDLRPHQILKKYGAEPILCNHIDIMEVAPLTGSLKVYAGRLHGQRMQDLPFHPDRTLTAEQKAICRLYCVNDLDNTELLYEKLKPEIALREQLTREFQTDVRSKSDAQIAEAVIQTELLALTGVERLPRAYVQPGTVYRYKAPDFLRYSSELMQWVLTRVKGTQFVVSEFGNIGLPAELQDLEIAMGSSVYRLGIGGLHSSEKTVSHYTNEDEELHDFDAESFYPNIILNQYLFPKHLGPSFLKVYRKIVDRRLAAKKAGDKIVSNSLKIVINGSFGKFGSLYSILYSPDLVIQVTLTGQLVLLMLIERLEMEGIPVVSANTDGIVVKCPRRLANAMYSIIHQWEKDTLFKTEETNYRSLHCRDVNNYIAIKPDGSTKTKGAYALAGLSKNPSTEICVEAAIAYLVKGVPVEQTIRQATSVEKFVTVRSVKGGAVKDGDYLGKVIRWYYSTSVSKDSEIVYASSGNKVPRSDGAKPVMNLPSGLPNDIDFAWYEQETKDILSEIGLATGCSAVVNNPPGV